MARDRLLPGPLPARLHGADHVQPWWGSVGRWVHTAMHAGDIQAAGLLLLAHCLPEAHRSLLRFQPRWSAHALCSPPPPHAHTDMYGPFWIATTLVFVTGVCGNYADFVAWRLAEAGAASSGAPIDPAAAGNSTVVPSPAPGTDPLGMQWYADYAKMSFSALLFYGYVFLFGMVLWLALRWFNGQVRGWRGRRGWGSWVLVRPLLPCVCKAVQQESTTYTTSSKRIYCQSNPRSS